MTQSDVIKLRAQTEAIQKATAELTSFVNRLEAEIHAIENEVEVVVAEEIEARQTASPLNQVYTFTVNDDID